MGRGAGRAIFVSVLLMIAGVLNVIYGIAAISNSNFFQDNTQFILSGLHTWGWVALLLGIAQVIASVSLMGGNTYGRIFGMLAASLSAVGLLLAIPAYPFWSLAIFALDLWIIYGLAMYGDEDAPAAGRLTRASCAYPLTLNRKAPTVSRRVGKCGGTSQRPCAGQAKAAVIETRPRYPPGHQTRPSFCAGLRDADPGSRLRVLGSALLR